MTLKERIEARKPKPRPVPEWIRRGIPARDETGRILVEKPR